MTKSGPFCVRFFSGYFNSIFSWLENPDNIGRLQIVLSLNAIVLSVFYYYFQRMFNAEPFLYVPFLPSDIADSTPDNAGVGGDLGESGGKSGQVD